MNALANALGMDAFELCIALGACVFMLSASIALLAATLSLKGNDP